MWNFETVFSFYRFFQQFEIFLQKDFSSCDVMIFWVNHVAEPWIPLSISLRQLKIIISVTSAATTKHSSLSPTSICLALFMTYGQIVLHAAQ